MSSISIGAVVSGVFFNMIATFVVGSIAIYLMMRGELGTLPLEQARAAFAVTAYARFGAPLVNAAILIISGYIAAAVAGKAERRHGALATMLYVVSGVVGLFTLSDVVIDEVTARNAVLLVVAPFLGMLGGYLRQRQSRRRVRADA